MRRKNRAKLPKKTPKNTQKPQKISKRGRKPTKFPKNWTKQARLGKQPAKSHLKPSAPSARTVPKRPNTQLASAKSVPCKERAKAKPAKSVPKRAAKEPGTNLARRPKTSQGEKTRYKAPKIVTSPNETSQIGARFDAPHSENRDVGARGRPKTGISKPAHALGRAASSRVLSPASDVEPKTEPKTCKKRAKGSARAADDKAVEPQDFKTLQAEWYAKLKAEGFQDLETSNNPDAPLSTRGAQPMANFRTAALQGRELYYRRLTNFMTHNPNWSNDTLYNLVATLYIDGISYRNMLPIIKDRLNRLTNIWRINKIIVALRARSKVWNRQHPEGIDFQPDLEPDNKRLKS